MNCKTCWNHCTALAAAAMLLILAVAPVTAPAAGGSYQPTWESLAQHPNPQWFADAKFGIYFHWGPYAVPAFGSEWYSRNMYVKGSRENKHHLARYGSLDKFGYKDFIPLFTAEKFNAGEWADLIVKSGAKFAGPVAEHADGFTMWNSKLTRWNAAQMGPKRDVVGELEKAIRGRNLHFMVSLHHSWLWAWYPTMDKLTDASNPEYAGLYGPPAPASAFHPRDDPPPSKAFCELWDAKTEEVVDNYRPDLVYFDSRLKMITEPYRLRMVSHYYNQARGWGKEVVLTYKDHDLGKGAGILDMERGRMLTVSPDPWMEDDSVYLDSWGYIDRPVYQSADKLVDELVDVVSKNGNLLLNVGPKPDGTIPEEARERLLAIGRWLRLNGEAIYGTRPWEVYGEGPTELVKGVLVEAKQKPFTARDVRFTTRGAALYATLLDWPDDGKAVIHSLPAGRKLWLGEIGQVKMLGVAEPLMWTRDETGLTVTLPAKKPCEYAFVLKITGR